MTPRLALVAVALVAAACSAGGEPQAAAPAPQPAPASTTTTAVTAAPTTTLAPTTTTSSSTTTSSTTTTTTTTSATTTTLAPPAGPDTEIARGLWLSYAAGDFEALAGSTAPRYDAGCAAEDLREASLIAETVPLSATVVEVDDLGDRAVVLVRVEVEGESQEFPVPLVLVDGRWYADVDHCPLARSGAELATQGQVRSAILAAKVFFVDNGHYDATPAELQEFVPDLAVAPAGAAPAAGEVAYVNSNGRLLIYAHSPLGRSFCAALFANDAVVYGSVGPHDVDGWDECAAVGAAGGWAEAPPG